VRRIVVRVDAGISALSQRSGASPNWLADSSIAVFPRVAGSIAVAAVVRVVVHVDAVSVTFCECGRTTLFL
jgi:hypothetical protein